MFRVKFNEWVSLREEREDQDETNDREDPFTTMNQKKGDVAYFGIHDLSRHYRKHGELPRIDIKNIGSKSGCILDADPIDQTVTVQAKTAPFHYGYRKLEDHKSKEKRKKMRGDQADGIQIKIPVSHLQDISHLLQDGGKEGKVWIVIDGNTKYQQNLMREIRKKEISRRDAEKNPQYDLIHIDDAPLTLDDDDQEDRKYMLKNREVVPAMEHINEFRPSILGYDRYWKTHSDNRIYEYFQD